MQTCKIVNDAIDGVKYLHSNFHASYTTVTRFKNYSHACESKAAWSTAQGGIFPRRSCSDRHCTDQRPTILPPRPEISKKNTSYSVNFARFACNSLTVEKTFPSNTHSTHNLVLLVLCHQFITDHALYRSLWMDVLQNTSSSLNNFIGDTCEQPNMESFYGVMLYGFFLCALSPETVMSCRKLRKMSLALHHVNFWHTK
jgi:hypothetical protein